MKLQSTRFSLNIKDFLKGAIVAVIIPALVTIQEVIADNGPINWKTIGMVAIGSFIGYIIKNFLTDDVKSAQNIIAVAEEKAIEKQQS